MNALLLVALGLARGATVASGAGGEECCIAKDMFGAQQRDLLPLMKKKGEESLCGYVKVERTVDGKRETSKEYPWDETYTVSKIEGATCDGMERIVTKSQCLMDKCLRHFTPSGYKRNVWRHLHSLTTGEPYFSKGKPHQEQYQILVDGDSDTQSDYLKYWCAKEVDGHECWERTCLKLKNFFGLLSKEEKDKNSEKDPRDDSAGRLISKEKDGSCPNKYVVSSYQATMCISAEVAKFELWADFGKQCKNPPMEGKGMGYDFAKKGAGPKPEYESMTTGNKKKAGASYEYSNENKKTKTMARTAKVGKLLRRVLKRMVAGE